MIKKQSVKESRSTVLNRLGLKEFNVPKIGYFTLNGIPCKMVNGVRVELKRVKV